MAKLIKTTEVELGDGSKITVPDLGVSERQIDPNMRMTWMVGGQAKHGTFTQWVHDVMSGVADAKDGGEDGR